MYSLLTATREIHGDSMMSYLFYMAIRVMEMRRLLKVVRLHCATACIAAEKLTRQWVGIDIAPNAADLVRSRLRDEVGLFYQGDTAK